MTELKAQNLQKRYGERTVVDGLNLHLQHGEIVGLLGPNGAGKTTTFSMIVGMVQPDDGEIFLNGQVITEAPTYQRAKAGLGYLPQEPSIFRKLTVRQNFQAILELTESDASRREERLKDLLRDFNLMDVADSLGYSLSGGERRRVEIARAIIPDPDFLLLDEPFSGVDPIAIEEVQDMIKSLSKREIGIFVTDHNVRDTLAITDRCYIINEGEILIAGDSETLINDPDAREVYLGSQISLDNFIIREEGDA